ncbi:hypothetical protein RhiLY_11149 [Ceratobasidium sp. AG-Ba]|nr:hypothetical protein RhiLY_11149 [Ceratobasidium sp. AG-Ba]
MGACAGAKLPVCQHAGMQVCQYCRTPPRTPAPLGPYLHLHWQLAAGICRNFPPDSGGFWLQGAWHSILTASPYILERKFRDQIKIYYSKDHGRYPNGWYVGDGAAYALVDALLQVRDAPSVPALQGCQFAFPIEPEKGFSMVDWQAPFKSSRSSRCSSFVFKCGPSYDLLPSCLVHYEGNTGGGNLPPFPHCAFIEGKKAFDDYTRTSCPSWWQEPDPEGVPRMWGNDEVWTLFHGPKRFLMRWMQHYYFAINDQERQDYIQELEELQKFKSSLEVPVFLIQNRLRARFEEMNREGNSQSSEEGPSEVVAPPSIPPGLEQAVITLDSDGEWESEEGYDSL